MALPTLATLLLSASLWQESVVPPEARLPLPHPVANAPIATVNDNRRPAGTRVSGTLSLSLDIIEAGISAGRRARSGRSHPRVRRNWKGAVGARARCFAPR
jgi:hypothetical protein